MPQIDLTNLPHEKKEVQGMNLSGLPDQSPKQAQASFGQRLISFSDRLIPHIDNYLQAREEFDKDIKSADNVVTSFLGDLFSIPFVLPEIAAHKMKIVSQKRNMFERTVTGMVEMGKLPLEFGQFFLQSVSDLIQGAEIPGTDIGVLPYPKEMRKEAQKRIKEHPLFTLLGAAV